MTRTSHSCLLSAQKASPTSSETSLSVLVYLFAGILKSWWNKSAWSVHLQDNIYLSNPPSPDAQTTVLLFQFVVLFLHDNEHDLPNALPPTQPANSVPTHCLNGAEQTEESPFHSPAPAHFSPTIIESDWKRDYSNICCCMFWCQN